MNVRSNWNQSIGSKVKGKNLWMNNCSEKYRLYRSCTRPLLSSKLRDAKYISDSTHCWIFNYPTGCTVIDILLIWVLQFKNIRRLSLRTICVKSGTVWERKNYHRHVTWNVLIWKCMSFRCWLMKIHADSLPINIWIIHLRIAVRHFYLVWANS